MYFCSLGDYKFFKKLEIEPDRTQIFKSYLKSWKFGCKFGLRGSFKIEKIPHTIGN